MKIASAALLSFVLFEGAVAARKGRKSAQELSNGMLKDGVYTIQQKVNNLFLDAHQSASADYSACMRDADNGISTKWLIKAIGVDLYSVQQTVNNFYLDAHQTCCDYSAVMRDGFGNNNQWIIKAVGTNQYTIVQKASNRFLDAHQPCCERSAVMRDVDNGMSTRWIIKESTGSWQVLTDQNHGVCAEHIKHVRDETPVSIPLLCTAQAGGVKVVFTGNGFLLDKMRLAVDGRYMGDKTWPFFGGTRMWEVNVGTLSAGLHILKFWGDVKFHNVRLQGTGADVCSFDTTPNDARRAQSNTYGGFDALNTIFGTPRPFSEFKKKQAFFSEETLGTNEDRTISSTVVQEGLWNWAYSYTQAPRSGDPLGDERNFDGLWNESKIKPWKQIQLNAMRGRSGQRMKVIEPCNTLSSLAMNEAAVWVTCKDYPFTRDEMASLITAFNALSAGTAFNHITGTHIGSHVDVFTMKWLMLQIYQIMIRDVVRRAGSNLNQAEKDALDTFGYTVGKATDLSKQMTRLFSEKYDRDFWEQQTRAIDIPDYTKSITGLIIFALYGIEGSIPIPGLDWALNTLIQALMNTFGVPQKEFFLNTYIPTVRKAMSHSRLCGDAIMPVVQHVLKFAVTFLEALVFQEEIFPMPKPVRDVFAWMDNLGLTGDLVSEMKVTWDYYNGFNCIGRSDHANWHEKAAHGLIHFTAVAELFVTKHGCR